MLEIWFTTSQHRDGHHSFDSIHSFSPTSHSFSSIFTSSSSHSLLSPISVKRQTQTELPVCYPFGDEWIPRNSNHRLDPSPSTLAEYLKEIWWTIQDCVSSLSQRCSICTMSSASDSTEQNVIEMTWVREP